MEKNLILFVCNYLSPEIHQILKEGDFPDVSLVNYPASCNAPATSDWLKNKISEMDFTRFDGCVFDNNCLSKSIPDPSRYPGLRFIQLQQCFDPFVNHELTTHYIQQGYYLVTNGWLRYLDQHIKTWGFEPAMARQFFGESMKKILFMDTQIPGDFLPDLKTLSEYMGLPYESIPIGLDQGRNTINALVSQWRYEKEHRSLKDGIAAAARQSADFMVIANYLERLVHLTDEEKILEMAREIITILFAPGSIHYHPRGIGEDHQTVNLNHTKKNCKNQAHGFVIELVHMDEMLGTIEVCDVQFPQFVPPYLEMGKTLGRILSIAIANARKYKVIREQKDQIAAVSRELETANKTKDKFFSIIAHDLRGPVSTAHGISEFLIEDIQTHDQAKAEKHANIVSNSLADILNLLNNLLEWARSQAKSIEFHPKLLSLPEITREVINVLSNQASKKEITLTMAIEDDCTIPADKEMLKTILRNLISNAIKFSFPGSSVRIFAMDKPDVVLVFIQDSGVGMDQEQMDNLFESDAGSSTRGTSNEKGTGLGLVLCREFAERHGGGIRVKSEEGKGSTFEIRFPKQASNP
jgi:signal transduction histidine kinase